MNKNKLRVINTDDQFPKQVYGKTAIASNSKATNEGLVSLKNKANYIYSKRRNYNLSKMRILKANK